MSHVAVRATETVSVVIRKDFKFILSIIRFFLLGMSGLCIRKVIMYVHRLCHLCLFSLYWFCKQAGPVCGDAGVRGALLCH